MATDVDWENAETLRDLVEKMRNGDKSVSISHELGQWFEKAARESGEKGSVFSEGIATSIYAALMIYEHEGYSPDVF